MVSRALALLSHPHLHGPQGFITLRLNGLVQTNDKLALREMARQLIQALDRTLSMEFDGLLTEEGVKEDEMEAQPCDHAGRFTTYANTLKNLMSLLEPDSQLESDSVAKPLVIVLEEFDLFAEHARQSFLYCLLDIVQGNKRRGGVCVIGTTAVVVSLDPQFHKFWIVSEEDLRE